MNSDSLVEFWSGAELSGRRPFVHKDDREAMKSMGDCGFQNYRTAIPLNPGQPFQ